MSLIFPRQRSFPILMRGCRPFHSSQCPFPTMALQVNNPGHEMAPVNLLYPLHRLPRQLLIYDTNVSTHRQFPPPLSPPFANTPAPQYTSSSRS